MALLMGAVATQLVLGFGTRFQFANCSLTHIENFRCRSNQVEHKMFLRKSQPVATADDENRESKRRASETESEEVSVKKTSTKVLQNIRRLAL
jgi:hypothetical protein